MGPEQDFEALVLQWEERVVLWDRLVGETLATSAAGSTLEEEDRDGAGARGGGWEVEFASVHRRMLLVASVEFSGEVDDDLASTGSTPSIVSVGDCRFGADGDSAASAEATGPEVAELLVQGLDRLQLVWAVRKWWSRVVEARKAMEARERGEARVRVAGVVKMVERWQSSGVFQEWKQAVVAGKRDRSVVVVVAGMWGRTVLRGFGEWKWRTRGARQLVAGEAGRMGQVVRGMHNRAMSVVSGSRGCDAVEPHPRIFINAMRVMRDVEDRLRSNGPGVWRLMARVRVMGIGRLVEGLARARVSWFVGHWRCVVRGQGAAVGWSGFGKNPNSPRYWKRQGVVGGGVLVEAVQVRQVCGGGAAVEGVQQVCGGGGAPGGAQQLCGGGAVPEGAQQMGGGGVPGGGQQKCGGSGAPGGPQQVGCGSGVPEGAQQMGGGGVPVGAQQKCGGGGAPGGPQQVGCGSGVPEGAQQVGGGGVPVGA